MWTHEEKSFRWLKMFLQKRKHFTWNFFLDEFQMFEKFFFENFLKDIFENLFLKISSESNLRINFCWTFCAFKFLDKELNNQRFIFPNLFQQKIFSTVLCKLIKKKNLDKSKKNGFFENECFLTPQFPETWFRKKFLWFCDKVIWSRKESC